jgi:hypothetical protein
MSLRQNAFTIVVLFNLFWMVAVNMISLPPPLDQRGHLWGATIVIAPSVASLMLYYFHLRMIGQGISPRAADSVYYLGFLITLMVLASSVLELLPGASEKTVVGPDDLQSVGVKFALGLLVTGLGLYFRIALQAGQLQSGDADTQMRKYIESMGLINDRIAQTETTLSSLLERVVAVAQSSAKDAGKEFVGVISSDLKPAVSDLKGAISQVGKVLDKFNSQQLNDFSQSATALASSLSDLQGAAPELTKRFSLLGDQLDKLVERGDNVGKAYDASCLAVGGLTLEVSKLAVELSPVASRFEAVGSSVSSLTQSMNAVPTVFDTVIRNGKLVEQALDQYASNVGGASTAVAGFNSSVRELSLSDLVSQLRNLGNSMQAQLKTFEELGRRLRDQESALSTIVNENATKLKERTVEMSDAASALGNAMVNLATEIAKAAEDVNR